MDTRRNPLRLAQIAWLGSTDRKCRMAAVSPPRNKGASGRQNLGPPVEYAPNWAPPAAGVTRYLPTEPARIYKRCAEGARERQAAPTIRPQFSGGIPPAPLDPDPPTRHRPLTRARYSGSA